MKRIVSCALVAVGVLALSGCHTDMWTQYKYSPLEPSEFFPNGTSSRMPVPGTMQRTQVRADDPFFTGFSDAKLVTYIPMEIKKEDIMRGKEKYRAFCSHCHGQVGNGQGMIAQRGFTLARPVGNYHTERLREMPVGHFFDVMTNGFGAMYPFKAKIEPSDRWRIAAYIRVLQLSQHATVADATAAQRKELSDPKPYVAPWADPHHGALGKDKGSSGDYAGGSH